MAKKVFLVFPTKSILILRDISVTRVQIPITPSFVVINYKIQEVTFRTAILDLHRKSNSENRGLIKKF